MVVAQPRPVALTVDTHIGQSAIACSPHHVSAGPAAAPVFDGGERRARSDRTSCNLMMDGIVGVFTTVHPFHYREILNMAVRAYCNETLWNHPLLRVWLGGCSRTELVVCAALKELHPPAARAIMPQREENGREA